MSHCSQSAALIPATSDPLCDPLLSALLEAISIRYPPAMIMPYPPLKLARLPAILQFCTALNGPLVGLDGVPPLNPEVRLTPFPPLWEISLSRIAQPKNCFATGGKT